MRQLAAIVTLLLVASCASTENGFAQARDAALRMISAELAGDLCNPAPIPAPQRSELSMALSTVVDPGLVDSTGLGPLNLAVLADDVASIKRLAELGYSLESSPFLLQDAALHDSQQSLSFLLASGANPDAANAYGATALMTAAANGRIEVAQALLTAGASPDLKNNDGGTALHYAIGCRDQSMISLLLGGGASVDAKAAALAAEQGLSLPQMGANNSFKGMPLRGTP